MTSRNAPPSYPAISFIVKHGDLLIALIALAVLALGFWALALGWHWGVLVIALLAAGAIWLLLRSYVEVLRILADTLMPR